MGVSEVGVSLSVQMKQMCLMRCACEVGVSCGMQVKQVCVMWCAAEADVCHVVYR